MDEIDPFTVTYVEDPGWLNLYSLAEPHLCSDTRAIEFASVRVKLMLAFIHDHCTDAINVDEIASEAGISRCESFRCFRQESGRKRQGDPTQA